MENPIYILLDLFLYIVQLYSTYMDKTGTFVNKNTQHWNSKDKPLRGT